MRFFSFFKRHSRCGIYFKLKVTDDPSVMSQRSTMVPTPRLRRCLFASMAGRQACLVQSPQLSGLQPCFSTRRLILTQAGATLSVTTRPINFQTAANILLRRRLWFYCECNHNQVWTFSTVLGVFHAVNYINGLIPSCARRRSLAGAASQRHCTHTDFRHQVHKACRAPTLCNRRNGYLKCSEYTSF